MNYFFKNFCSYLFFAFFPAAISIALALFFINYSEQLPYFNMLSETTQVKITAGLFLFSGLWIIWSYYSKHGEKTINSWGSNLFGPIECDLKEKVDVKKQSFFRLILGSTFMLLIILGPSIIIYIFISQINWYIALALTIITIVVWFCWTTTEYGSYKVEIWSNTLVSLLINKFVRIQKNKKSGRTNYCPTCGTKVGYKDNYCFSCGKKLKVR